MMPCHRCSSRLSKPPKKQSTTRSFALPRRPGAVTQSRRCQSIAPWKFCAVTAHLIAERTIEDHTSPFTVEEKLKTISDRRSEDWQAEIGKWAIMIAHYRKSQMFDTRSASH